MHRITRFLPHAAAALLFALAIAGCAGQIGPDPARGGARLEVLGDGLRVVAEHGEHVLRFRYVDANGAPIPAQALELELLGDGAGASFAIVSPVTDDDGIAATTLRTGTAAELTVEARAPEAAPAQVDVEVRRIQDGTLDYVVRRGGMRSPERVLAGLFTNTACAESRRGTISPAEVRAPRIGVEDGFGRVEAGITHAVWAVGLDILGNVVSQVCADVVVDEEHEHVDLVLVDIDDLVAGSYELDVELDLTAGLHPALDTLLFVLRVLGSPPDEGARLLVEWAATSPASPGFLRTALGDPLVRRAVASALVRALEAIHPPEWLDRIIYAGAEVDRALSATVLRTELVLPAPDAEGRAVASHRLHTLVLPRVLRDGMPAVLEERVSARGMVDVTVGPDPHLGLAEHVLPVSFGALMEVLLRDILLPAFGSSAATLGGALREVLDCSRLTATIADARLRDLGEAVCNLGVEVLGAAVEERIVTLWSYDAMALTCDAELIDGDRDLDRESVRLGTCDAVWSGTSGDLVLAGSMRGRRMGDDTGRDHAIRDSLLAHLP